MLPTLAEALSLAFRSGALSGGIVEQTLEQQAEHLFFYVPILNLQSQWFSSSRGLLKSIIFKNVGHVGLELMI